MKGHTLAKLSNFQLFYNQVATKWANKCETFINSWDGYNGFFLNQLKLDWSPRRTSSRGGWYDGPGISIGMVPCTRFRIQGEVFYQHEYASYEKDPIIGGFYSSDISHSVGLHVCHEMAHAVQFYADKILGIQVDRAHGESFKTPYRLIRSKLFNPTLEDQIKLKKIHSNVYNLKKVY